MTMTSLWSPLSLSISVRFSLNTRHLGFVQFVFQFPFFLIRNICQVLVVVMVVEAQAEWCWRSRKNKHGWMLAHYYCIKMSVCQAQKHKSFFDTHTLDTDWGCNSTLSLSSGSSYFSDFFRLQMAHFLLHVWWHVVWRFAIHLGFVPARI